MNDYISQTKMVHIVEWNEFATSEDISVIGNRKKSGEITFFQQNVEDSFFVAMIVISAFLQLVKQLYLAS